MPLNKKERKELGLVGKRVFTNKKTGKKSIIDFESDDISVLCGDEIKERLGIGKPLGKNFSKIYDESGKVIGIKEIIEKEDD